MMLVLLFFMSSVALEIAVLWPPKRYDWARMIITSFGIGLLCALSIYLLADNLQLFSVFFGIISIYRVVNLLRIEENRMHPAYLQRTCLRSTVWLAGAQAELWMLKVIWDRIMPAPKTLWLALAVVQLGAAGLVLVTVRRHARHASTPVEIPALRHDEMPTITVAVAARNETDSLASCIESILASDYPKLEILVLDDSSQTRRTPEIIRSFAHDGVRFIPGAEPKDTWLARNQACDTLARAANGTYILYCSTSLRLEPDSIRKMLSYALAKKKTMLSFMPRFEKRFGRQPLIEPMRAAWELLPPRRWLGRPPVMSTCWLIKTSSLQAAGGFAAVSRMITPEAHFARVESKTDGYGFVPGGAYFGVSSQKPLAEQQDTALRTAYPSLHRRPEMVFLTTVMLSAFAIVPFGMVFLVVDDGALALVSLVSLVNAVILLVSYRQVLILTYGRASLVTVFSFPVAVLLAVYMQHWSMYDYEFRDVVWKDRSVRDSVMHAIPHLPEV